MSNHFISHPTPDQLAAFDLGQLRAAEWQEVERHVAACADCCHRLENLSEDALVRLVRQSGSKTGETMDQLMEPTGLPGEAGPSQVPAALIDHPRYRVIEVLGAGGMGVVYKAEHRLMERIVALKAIAHTLLDNPGAEERFHQEVKAAARLAHPNIVTAYDAEQAGDVHFLVMEYVEGASLDKVLHERGPLPVAEACALARQVALGLQHAHEKGMVHRDLKPGNLLLQHASPDAATDRASAAPQAARVKIADFGLARFVSESASAEALTASGALVGTPDYIAPEQAVSSHTADIRADIYSLGCTLYHLLAGRPPFSGGSVLQKLIAHREKPVPPLAASRPDAPVALLQVVDRMLAKDPAQRMQTPAEVAEALLPFTQRTDPAGTPPGDIPLRIPRWVGVSAGVGLLAAIGGLLLLDLNSQGPTAQAPMAQTPTTAVTPAPAQTGSEPARSSSRRSSDPVRPSRAPTIEELRKEARAQAIAWLRANNPFGPKASFMPERIKQIDEDQEDGFVMALGPGLVKSRRPTYLVVRAGRFYVFELTESQARFVPLKNNNSIWVQYVPHDKAAWPQPPPVQLSDLKIDNADQLPNDRTFSGTVRFRGLRQLPGDLAVRISYWVGEKRNKATRYLTFKAGTERGLISFSAGPMTLGPDSASGPQIIFVELVTVADRSRPDDATVVSSSTAALVIAVPPDEKK